MKIEVELLPHQKKALMSKAYITSMSCGIGAGKSYAAALVNILHQLEGKRVLVVMPTLDNIKRIHIFQMLQILNSWGLPYRHNKTSSEISVGKGSMISKSEENADTINGLTQIDTVIIDECRFISEMTFVYSYSRQRGVKDARMYLFGTGCSKRTWFARESMDPKAVWITASCLDNVRHNGQAYVDRIMEKYRNQEQYFIDRELYGRFVDGDEQSLFSEINANAQWKPGGMHGGFDIAIAGGADYTAAAIFNGNKVVFLGKKKTLGMPAAQQWLNQLAAQFGCQCWSYDATGQGRDNILEGADPVLFGDAGLKPYMNKRAEIYFALKAVLAEGVLIEEPYLTLFNSEAVPELAETRTIDRETRMIQLVPKQEIRNILGRSPDLSDALALAAYTGKYAESDFDAAKIRQMQHASNPYRSVR